jgi:hypothetical protein
MISRRNVTTRDCIFLALEYAVAYAECAMTQNFDPPLHHQELGFSQRTQGTLVEFMKEK